MAKNTKSLLATKGKPKVARKTKSETYLINRKYYGDEPDSTKFETGADIIRAFTWYNNMVELSEARQYLKDYFKTDKSMCKIIDKIPEKRIPLTAAWLCRIADNGKRELHVNHLVYVNDEIKIASGYHEEESDEPIQKVERPNIQNRIKDRASDIIGDIEEMIDHNASFSLYEWLKVNEIPAMYAKHIADYYIGVETEMRLALIPKGQDGSIDGYENWSKADIRERAEFYGRLRSDAERYAGNIKKARVPRKKKAPSVDKLLKYFVYLKEYNEHKLTSINPQSIIGAQTLWTFNTKNNVLSVFNASGRSGLSINRTAIAGYDTNTSKSMKIGRKTKERLESVLKGGKIVIRRLVEEMGNEVTERINNSTILLKAVR